jgi:hypothetical protein
MNMVTSFFIALLPTFPPKRLFCLWQVFTSPWISSSAIAPSTIATRTIKTSVACGAFWKYRWDRGLING